MIKTYKTLFIHHAQRLGSRKNPKSSEKNEKGTKIFLPIKLRSAKPTITGEKNYNSDIN